MSAFEKLTSTLDLALAWSAMLWFDTAIFALTFYKAIQVRHDMPGTLLVTMFRDGKCASSGFEESIQPPS